MLNRFHNWLLNWKPIHLCFVFEYFGWPVPKYFIGGGSGPYLIQDHWAIGDDDNADPDNCTFDTTDTTRTDQAKEENFMIRIQVINDANDSTALQWQLYYNDSDDASTAVQVGTALDSDIQVDSSLGTPAEEAAVGDYDVVFDNTENLTWMDGEYDEIDGGISKFMLEAGKYTDFQFCVQLTELAQDEQTYYFFIRYGGAELDSYQRSAKVTSAESEITPIPIQRRRMEGY